MVTGTSEATKADADKYIAGELDLAELEAGCSPATGLADFVDPYVDPATGILNNLLGARTQADLDAGTPCPGTWTPGF